MRLRVLTAALVASACAHGAEPMLRLQARFVSDYRPRHGNDIEPDGSVIITFKVKMDHESVTRAFRIQPPVPGRFRWAWTNTGGETVFFEPTTARLPRGQSYWVRLAPTAATLRKTQAKPGLSWGFRIAPRAPDKTVAGRLPRAVPLAVRACYPQPNARDVFCETSILALRFNQPLTSARYPATRPIGEWLFLERQAGARWEAVRVASTLLGWESRVLGPNSWLFRFVPSSTHLLPYSHYRARVTTALETHQGQRLGRGLTWTFDTGDGILSVYPAEDADGIHAYRRQPFASRSPYPIISVTLSHPLPPQSVTQRTLRLLTARRIAQRRVELWEQDADSRRRDPAEFHQRLLHLTLSRPLWPGLIYSVLLDGDLRSADRTLVLRGDKVWQFRTAPERGTVVRTHRGGQGLDFGPGNYTQGKVERRIGYEARRTSTGLTEVKHRAYVGFLMPILPRAARISAAELRLTPRAAVTRETPDPQLMVVPKPLRLRAGTGHTYANTLRRGTVGPMRWNATAGCLAAQVTDAVRAAYEAGETYAQLCIRPRHELPRVPVADYDPPILVLSITGPRGDPRRFTPLIAPPEPRKPRRGRGRSTKR